MSVTEVSKEEIAEIHARYRAAERDKRLRDEGNEQYIEVVGEFAHYVEDPYVEVVERDPVTDHVTCAFIGGGFGGLVTGARLKEHGIDDVRIIEKGGDFGGTWYWNRYPGAQCDTASFVYMPLLEETGHMPTEKYAHAPEILEHSRRIAKHFGLYDNALLSTEVIDLMWNEANSRWTIKTNRGDEFTASFVLMSTGPLHRPKLPGIDGIRSFKGHTFHTSRWDYDYTGGDPAGAPLTGLADKRVAIIGTGATSVQCIPHLARAAKELFVFQRTPSSIDIRNNVPTDKEWFENEVLEPGWQKKWLENFTLNQTGGFAEEDLVMDGWTDLARRIRDRLLSGDNPDLTPAGMMRAYQESDDEKMNEIRNRVDDVVEDPAMAEALKPWYRQLCKRPCFHDDYLLAFNEPAMNLIDTDGKGVDKIDETGLWVDGEHYEVDCIIYATGFEVGTAFTRRAGFDALGANGVKLSDYWEKGMRTMHGMFTHNFPNLFTIGATQGAALISNYPHNLTEASTTAATVIKHALDNDIREVEVTAEAEQGWLDVLQSGQRGGIMGSVECTPGYYNNEGKGVSEAGALNLGYPGGAMAFFKLAEDWRSTGDFEGLELR